ncbi:MAG: ParA family protein [Peptococcaceae bacterium]|nr:ParA family protein [Peptococcaceae bacterium]
MNNIIAIANQKGGVAKTTSAVNLSASLAEKGCSVLLIDLDPQGNATTGSGIAKQKLTKCIYDCLINNTPVQDVIVDSGLPNFWVAPARIELAGAEIELVAEINREGRLASTLYPIADSYDFIIIDCPPSLGLLTLNALCAATHVLIPIQCEFYALQGVTLLLKTLDRVRRSINRELEIMGVLLTMFDARTNLSIQVVDEVKNHFRDKVFRTIVPRNIRLSEAPSHGVPIIIYDPKSRGADVYRELAKEVLERVEGIA